MLRSAVAVLVLLLAACASAGLPTKPNDREWNALLARYQTIEGFRAATPIPPAEASRKSRIQALLEQERKIQPMYDPFLASVREYLDRTGDPRAARLYADEKVRLGDQYMNVLSRYDRATSMYQAALEIDPQNAKAQAGLAAAQSRKYVTLDRFAAITSGMKDSAVEQIVGLPREDWIKQLVQKNRVFTVWIYPRQDGGAAAVYFQDGVVYHTNWNASPAPGDSK